VTRARSAGIAGVVAFVALAAYYAFIALGNPYTGLQADDANANAQSLFQHFLDEGLTPTWGPPPGWQDLRVLLVPGWDYEENGEETGADMRRPLEWLRALGFECRRIDVPPTGSVEEIAHAVTRELTCHAQSGRDLVIVGASSAGAAIHLSLGEQLGRRRHQQRDDDEGDLEEVDEEAEDEDRQVGNDEEADDAAGQVRQ